MPPYALVSKAIFVALDTSETSYERRNNCVTSKAWMHIPDGLATLSLRAQLQAICLWISSFWCVCIFHKDFLIEPLSEWCYSMNFGEQVGTLLVFIYSPFSHSFLSILLEYLHCTLNTDVSLVGVDSYFQLTKRQGTSWKETLVHL